MKKYITTIVLMVFMMFGSFVPATFAAKLTPEEITLIVQMLDKDNQFTSEQIVQIITILSSQGANDVSSNTGVKNITLKPGQLCGFRYLGDESVVAIQQELKDQGYTITKVDGKIGPETRAAVTKFQTDNQAQKIDGLIGEETRGLLTKTSLGCAGEPGVVVGSTTEGEVNSDNSSLSQPQSISSSESALCKIRYNGDESIVAIQQELKGQGYTITKVDGKIGPETRAAVTKFQTDNQAQKIDGLIGEEVRILLVRKSVQCSFETQSNPAESVSSNNETTVVTNQSPSTSDENVVEVPSGVTIEQTPSTTDVVQTGNLNFVIKDEILAAVRTANQTPDDTAVFTYRMTLNPDTNVYISSSPEATFDINIYNQEGALVSVEKVKSIIASAEKILRQDGKTYYRMRKGDTVSLRATAQPGPGVYYAELGRFTYTTQDAQTVLNPEVVNYGLDAQVWRSGVVTLKN